MSDKLKIIRILEEKTQENKIKWYPSVVLKTEEEIAERNKAMVNNPEYINGVPSWVPTAIEELGPESSEGYHAKVGGFFYNLVYRSGLSLNNEYYDKVSLTINRGYSHPLAEMTSLNTEITSPLKQLLNNIRYGAVGIYTEQEILENLESL